MRLEDPPAAPALKSFDLILRHTFTPPNNTRMGHLCGPTDAHLRSIEAALQVRIAHRFEQFKVEGAKAKAELALQVLQALYEIADRPIAPDQVQLMLAGDLNIDADGTPLLSTRRADLRARTANQASYLMNIAEHDITFGIGPAGTGKTYLAVACAVDALERNAVQRIVLTRPAVEAGERLGFLPGDLTEKVDPYMAPIWEALTDILGADQMRRRRDRGEIEVAPIAFMRGRTLSHCFVICDEAQNATTEQMFMFLTRLGNESKCVITGDRTQIDLPRNRRSGLLEAVEVLKNIEGIDIRMMSQRDVVRHPLVQAIINAYEEHREPPTT
jgi:phosphate starvation-inducible PhoH-like protein